MNIYCNIARGERSALNLRVKQKTLPLVVVKTTYLGVTGWFFATNYRDGLGLVSKNMAHIDGNKARQSEAKYRYGRGATTVSELVRKQTAKVVVGELAKAA